MNAWLEGSLDVEVSNVFRRLEKVLLLLNDGCGENDLVETKRKVTDIFKFDFIKNLVYSSEASMDFSIDRLDVDADGNGNEAKVK